MPAYEMFFSIARLPRAELVATLKRIGERVLDEHGLIRKLEYLGTRNYADAKTKLRSRLEFVESASFFCMHTDLPQESRDKLYDHFKLEDNLIKCQITPKLRKDGIIPPGYQCTLSEELLPPSQRPSVQMLISEGRKAPTARPVNYGPHGKRWVYKEEVIDPTDEKVDLE